MLCNLPTEIWMMIADILGENHYLRSMENLLKVIGIKKNSLEYYNKTIKYYRFGGNGHQPYIYDDLMVEIFEK